MTNKKIASESEFRDHVARNLVGMVAAQLRALDVDVEPQNEREQLLRERVEALAEELAEQALELVRYRGVDVAARLAPRRRARSRRPAILVEVAEPDAALESDFAGAN